MHKVGALLLDVFGTGDWSVEKPHSGSKKECYIATSHGQRVFIKFDTGALGLERLGETGIAPRLLAHGVYEGQTYVVQEFLEGDPPDRGWLGCHIREAGEVFARYHADASLLSLLRSVPDAQTSAERHPRREVEPLRRRMGLLSDSLFLHEPVFEAVSRFHRMSETLISEALVPTHDEPNTSNMLVHSGRLVLLDWDDIRLADPLRDLGPFIWWYLPEDSWEELLSIAGMEPRGDVRQKIFWFAARASLDIGLWHLERGSGTDRGFLGDFVAAVNLQPNPRTRG